MLLSIQNLHVAVGEKPILQGTSLAVSGGGVHVIMGPNGSGKSTLCHALMGHPAYQVTRGKIVLNGENITRMKTDERARRGMFLSFQYPREIPGVSVAQMLRAALFARVKDGNKKEPFVLKDFHRSIRTTLADFGLSEDFFKRALNENASGGEKKRMEMVQLFLLKPQLAILDEIDSGLDIDAMKRIGAGIERAARELGTTFIVITHYQRLLQHLSYDHVHVMVDGRIVESGGPKLVETLERDGYKAFLPS